MDRKLRLGIIGIGMAWDRLHYPALQKLEDKYEIVAVCNKSLDKAAGFAQGISLAPENVYDDYTELLKRTDLDAVDLLVPISENFEIAEAVISSGKNLIAEKPFASSPKAALQLIQLKNKHNVTVMVAENFRYDEGNAIIKEILAGGSIGQVMYFVQVTGADFANDMKQNTFAAKEWRQKPSYAGGSFLDGGIHDIARFRYLFGELEKVVATGRPWEQTYCPYMAINSMLKFQNGVTGHYIYYADGAELQKPPIGLRIFGELGEIYYESKDKGVIDVSYKDGTKQQRTFTPNNGYYYELLNYYDAVAKGQEILSTPEKELGDIQAIFDILSSIAAKQI